MPRVGLTPDLIVAAAAELVDEAGLEALTLSALGRRLGVTTAALYAHLGGAEDLLARLSARCLNESADLVADAVAGRAGHDALAAYAEALRGYARRHPGRYAASRLPVTSGSPALAAGRRHSDLARAVLRGYGLDRTGEVHATRLLGSTIHGFTSLELGGSFAHSRPSAATTWAEILDALHATLEAWGARRPAVTTRS